MNTRKNYSNLELSFSGIIWKKSFCKIIVSLWWSVLKRKTFVNREKTLGITNSATANKVLLSLCELLFATCGVYQDVYVYIRIVKLCVSSSLDSVYQGCIILERKYIYLRKIREIIAHWTGLCHRKKMVNFRWGKWRFQYPSQVNMLLVRSCGHFWKYFNRKLITYWRILRQYGIKKLPFWVMMLFGCPLGIQCCATHWIYSLIKYHSLHFLKFFRNIVTTFNIILIY